MSVWITFSSPIGKYCQLDSVSMSQSTRAIAGGVRRTAQIDDLHANKSNDYLSNDIFLACAKGTHFDEISIEFFTSNDALYLSYTLSDAVITSFLTGLNANGPQFSINAKSFSAKYF